MSKMWNRPEDGEASTGNSDLIILCICTPRVVEGNYKILSDLP